MTSLRLRWALGLTAIVAAACMTAAPASARDCRGAQCNTAKMKGKVAAQPKRVRNARVRRPDRRVVARSNRTRVAGKWQGWGGSFYLDGTRFAGGNPSGPAAWYNNWEGGFHPVAFWTLHDRQRP